MGHLPRQAASNGFSVVVSPTNINAELPTSTRLSETTKTIGFRDFVTDVQTKFARRCTNLRSGSLAIVIDHGVFRRRRTRLNSRAKRRKSLFKREHYPS